MPDDSQADITTLLENIRAGHEGARDKQRTPFGHSTPERGNSVANA